MLLGAGAGVVLGLACTAGGDDPRAAVLEHIARGVAVPAFASASERASATADALAAFCDRPDADTLAAVRLAWEQQRDAWDSVLPFGFGPLPSELNALDFWPVRPNTIEAAIAEATTAGGIGPGDLDGLGTSAKGMPAVEYLLWGEDPSAVVSAMSEPSLGPIRCAYAVAVAEDVAARLERVRLAWTPDYADTLASAGAGSEAYDSLKAGIDEVVNKEIEALLVMVKGKLDTPLGNLTGAAVDPSLLESRFSGRSLIELQTNLAGAWAVYHGADVDAAAAGLSVLVADVDPSLDERVRAQYARTVEVLAAVPQPISVALVDDRSAVQSARDELDTLRRMIKLDVASALGVTLALSDNDGD